MKNIQTHHLMCDFDERDNKFHIYNIYIGYIWLFNIYCKIYFPILCVKDKQQHHNFFKKTFFGGWWNGGFSHAYHSNALKWNLGF